MAEENGTQNAQGALFDAIEKGDVEGIKKAVKAGADVNARNDYGRTALDMAVQNALGSGDNKVEARAKAVDALLAVPGIDVTARDSQSIARLESRLQDNKQEALNNSLFEAAKKGDVEGIKKAIEAGADVNAKDRFSDDTPLHRAVIGALGGNDPKAVEALLAVPGIYVSAKDSELMADLQTRNEEQRQYTLNRPLLDAAKEGDVEGITKAIGAGANVNAKGDGFSDIDRRALHMAAASGNAKAVDALLAAPEIDVNAKDQDGFTAVHLAAFQGNADTLQALLKDPRVDLDAKDEKKMTALDRARKMAEKEPDKYKPIVEVLENAAKERAKGQEPKSQDDNVLIIAHKLKGQSWNW